ncbi:MULTISPECIES: FAD binding domain-containing protein [Amycolatopsis]|uniref:Xanthine dehydrogenase family protein subunit M n=1 Tax=Amycolatopsis dongchuanensis TaxID=1070866 RepID=A0ABP9QUL7_9PSEU
MKAAPFAYSRPSTVDEAVAELTRSDGGGKVISGGQSLVPVLAMRLARPDVLVDINAIPGLDRIERGDGYAELGATVRQRTVERDPVSSEVPLLGLALPWVGHRELRSRGTVCGSLAHADPAAELPAVACCLDASLTLAGPSGTRRVAAREFFAGAMMTALGPDELLTAVRFPSALPGDGFGFAEIARRHGDFALAGVAVHVRGEGVTLTGFGISDRPVTRAVALDEVTPELLDEMVDTDGDAHASRDYRRRLFRVLARREIDRATRKARNDDR